MDATDSNGETSMDNGIVINSKRIHDDDAVDIPNPVPDPENDSQMSRHHSMDDTLLRDRMEPNDVYWSADYKDTNNLQHSESIESEHFNSGLEQSLEYMPLPTETRDDIGYMSAPEGYTRLILPVQRRSRGRSRSRRSQRDLLYYNIRSRSVSRTRTPYYKGLQRHKSLENLPGSRVERHIDETFPESEEEEPEKPKTLKNATFQQKVTLVGLAVADFNSFMCLALMAPFFPQEAESRSVTSSQTGWIFGVFALVQCLTSPFFGKLLPHLGPRFTFLSGNFFAGACTILFGMVDYFPDNTTLFLVFTFLIRIFLALGCTAVSCSIFALATSTFPDNPSFVLGLLESAIGVGLMAGPALGGILYGALGFKGPFFVVGGFILLTTPVFACILDVPSMVPDDNVSEEEEGGKGFFRQLLSIPTVIVALIATFVSSVMWIIFDPILEPHLRQFKLSSSALGGVFLLMSGTYAILAPIVGKIADHVENSTPIMMTGHLVGCGGLLLLGPSPIIGLGGVNELWLNLLALFFMGVFVTLAIVPTFDKLLDAAEEFVGPTLAGWAVSVTTFAWFLTYCAAGCLGTAVMLLFLWIYEYFKWKKPSSKDSKDLAGNFTAQEPSETTHLLA